MSGPEEKLAALSRILSPLPGLSVALSGGLDSTVLLTLAARVLGRARTEALTVLSPIMEEGELTAARLICLKEGVKHRFVPFDHLAHETFRRNPPDRCYHCKRAMFERLLREASFPLADGTQQDDLREERPGLKALRELKILSPLKEAGFTKDELRRLARRLGLTQYLKEPSPCLATRILPGEEITKEKLSLVRKAEAYLRAQGFARVRVRFSRMRALVEVSPSQTEALWALGREIVAHLKGLGFKKVYFDPLGYEPPLKRP